MQVYGSEMGSHYRGRILYKITAQKDLINKNRYLSINLVEQKSILSSLSSQHL